MLDKETIDKEAVSMRTALAEFMIIEGIKDGSLQDFINAKIDDMRARIDLYKYMEVVGK